MGWIVAVIAVAAAVAAAVRAQNAARSEHLAVARAELAERQSKSAEARTAALIEEIRQLAHKRIPAAALALSHPSAPVPGLREAAGVDGDSARLLTEAVQAARTAVVEERGRGVAAAAAGVRGAAPQIQGQRHPAQRPLRQR
ncbi:ATP-binding protein, partial [Streptomyces sp. NPDC002540]